MSGNRTFTMIKPTSFKNGDGGNIIARIIGAGFKVIALKMVKLTPERAAQFYTEHDGKPFYKSLCSFMSSGPVVCMVLEKEDAVEAYREFIGATNPEEAAEGTIRKLYGTDLQQNAVHGADSDESASREASFFFSELEIVIY